MKSPATTPGSTFSIRSSLSVSTRSSAFSRRTPACDTCDPSNQDPRIDTAFASRLSVRRGFNSLDLQARDKVNMLVVSTINIFFSWNLRENGVKFPEQRNVNDLDHQHGRRDVTWKSAIDS